MNWIRLINYGPLYGGANAGILAYTILFSGEAPDMDQGEMASTLIKLRDAGGRKSVNLTGKFPSNDSYMYTFCRALKDSGYQIVAHSNGQIYHSWFTLVDWLVVENAGEPWVVFKCKELLFFWDGVSPLPEVTPELETTQFILRAADTVESSLVLNTLSKAGLHWRLYVKPEEIIGRRLL